MAVAAQPGDLQNLHQAERTITTDARIAVPDADLDVVRYPALQEGRIGLRRCAHDFEGRACIVAIEVAAVRSLRRIARA